MNQRVANDLVSTATTKADLKDFDRDPGFSHKNTILPKIVKEEKDTRPDDLRSVRSEFDYGSKKKFTDVLGGIKRNRLTLKSDRSSNNDALSVRTKASL